MCVGTMSSGYGRASGSGSQFGGGNGSVWRSSASIISTGSRRRSTVLKIPKMQRRVPKNQRYQHVQATVDTGMNMAKFVNKPVRIGEIFTRMRCKELHQLLIQHHEVGESIYQLGNEEQEIGEGKSVIGEAKSASTLGGALDAAQGVVVEIDKLEQQEGDQRPFILLDLRTEKEYDKAHIRSARSFPAIGLRQDKMPVDLYRYKAKPGRFVVIYCDDERVATETGTIMVQKGFNKVFVLVAGITEYARRFSEDLEGDLTVLLPVGHATSSTSVRVPHSNRSSAPSSAATASTRSMVAPSGVSRRSLTSSRKSAITGPPWKPPA